MNGHNLTFRSDPIWYITQRAINNVSWFMKDQANNINQQRNRILNGSKTGAFDLLGEGQAKQVALAPTGNPPHSDPLITAYWCPFVQGNVLPGFVDIPMHNPEHQFVFTAAMNGCALVTTTSPLGSNMLRVYHHQHPDSPHINNLIKAQGQTIISSINANDYCHRDQKIPAPNAFNFLLYKEGRWKYAVQPQTFNMLTHDVTLNPGMPSKILDI